MVLGIYYLSQSDESGKNDKSKGYFSNVAEIEQAIETKSYKFALAKIICRFETVDDKGKQSFWEI